MSLESNIAELKKELETGERNSEGAYKFNCLTREITEDVVEVQPDEIYVKQKIIPLFEKALDTIKISSAKGSFVRNIEGFVNCVKERIDYLRSYEPILRSVYS